MLARASSSGYIGIISIELSFKTELKFLKWSLIKIYNNIQYTHIDESPKKKDK